MRFLMVVLLLAACSDKKPTKSQPASTSEPSAPSAPTDRARAAGGLEVKVPEVAGPGTEPMPEQRTMVTISAALELTIDHRVLGVVPSNGNTAPLKRVVEYLQGLPEHGSRAIVAADSSLRFSILYSVLEAVTKGGFLNLGLVATKQGATVIVPVRVAESTDSATSAHAPALMKKPPQLGLVLQVTTRKLLLWSTSGEEGTQAAPKYDHPLDGNFTQLTATLDEIVKRRFGTPGALRDQTIVVMVDPEQNVQVLLDALAAVGKAFPDVQLSMGVR